jgi:Cof subfamily protein (haloacid dehalogenase superfamily)
MVRVVAVDIDGTLLDSAGELPDINRRVVARVLARGIEVWLATGRNFYFAAPIVAALPEPLTLIVSNGAVVKTGSGRTLDARPLDAGTARRVLEATREFHHEGGLVFDGDAGGFVTYGPIDWSHPNRAAYFARNREFIRTADDLLALATERPVAIMFNGSMARMASLGTVLATLPGRDAVSVTRTAYPARDFCLVDVMAAGCSKGATLARWAATRDIPLADILAIGDNENDLEMLERCGRPVAMGNSVDAVLARPWPVTSSNDEGGVARAIERYVLDADGDSAWQRDAAAAASGRRGRP